MNGKKPKVSRMQNCIFFVNASHDRRARVFPVFEFGIILSRSLLLDGKSFFAVDSFARDIYLVP